MKRIVILLLVCIFGLHAAEMVTKSNVLGAGESIRFYPKQGESFAVTKDLNRFAPDANYDIVMRNGREIYFANRNEHDDIYIVFNEPLAKGDVVVLKVNRGAFTYTTRRIQELPKSVKKILKAAKKRSHRGKQKVEKRGEVLVTTDAFCFDDRGEIVECSSPRATINQKKSQTALVAKPTIVSEVKPQTERYGKENASISPPQKGEKHEGENLFISFAEKIKAALSKIKTTLSKTKTDQSAQSVQREKPLSTPPKVEHAKKSDQKRQLPKRADIAAVAQKSPQKSPAEIARYAHAKQVPIQLTQSVPLPRFHTPSVLVEYRGKRFPAERITTTLVGPEIKEVEIRPVTQSPATEQVAAPELYHKSESAKVERISSFDHLQSRLEPPKYHKAPQPSLPSQVQSSRTAAPVIRSKIILPATAAAEAPLPRIGIPKAAPKPEAPRASEVAKRATAPKVFSPATLPVSVSQRPRAESFPEVSRLEQTEAASVPETRPMTKPAATAVPETAEVATPQIAEEERPKDKIVITKIIEKKSPAPAAEPMIPMRDRMLGGGYSADQHVGKVSVSAYANRKPISAWVEVYRGKRRVKTFYSGAKKEVTLPEGTYLLKATYRTGTSKQRKRLGKIRLKSGETIHKKVYFSIGTLNVKVMRNGKPIYAKVEIYPKGSKRRYAYTFTSRSSGVAHLQLSAGSYRIVVKAHDDTRVLENVHIGGSRTKTVPVEF